MKTKPCEVCGEEVEVDRDYDVVTCDDCHDAYLGLP